MSLNGDSLLLSVIEDYLTMEGTAPKAHVLAALSAEDELDQNESNDEDPFLTYKTLSLESFQTLEKVYVKIKNRLAADYSLFEFLYVSTDDVWSLFELVRRGPWSFDRDDELAQLVKKNEARRKQLELEGEYEDDDSEGTFDSLDSMENSYEMSLEESGPAIEIREVVDEDGKSGFRKFARQRKEMMGDRELTGRGVMMSGLMASHLEQIDEKDEGDESGNVETPLETSLLDTEEMGEIFRPQPVTFEKVESTFIVRFKVFSVRLGARYEIEGASAKERKVLLQVLFKGDPVLSDIFDTQDQEFESRNQTYEISTLEKSHALDLRCQVGSEAFQTRLPLHLFYDNTFERLSVALVSESRGHIHVDLALVVQSPDEEPYGGFVSSDAGYVFDIDRLIDSDLVLKKPNLLEINSTKNMVDMKVEFDDALHKMGKKFRNQFLMFIGGFLLFGLIKYNEIIWPILYSCLSDRQSVVRNKLNFLSNHHHNNHIMNKLMNKVNGLN